MLLSFSWWVNRKDAEGHNEPLCLRSIVGLVPLFAVQVLEQHGHENLPGLAQRLLGFLHHRPDLASLVSRWYEPGKGNRIRSLSKAFEQPFAMQVDGKQLYACYEPAESDSRLYGGNSNWRGPLWMPINYLLIESLREFHRYYDVNCSVEYPQGSGYLASLAQVVDGLSQRLTRLFLLAEEGRRLSMSGYPQLQTQAEDRALVLFHEYFHGETGRGLGASHQTGWTALVALLLQP